jgi:adenylate kinase
VVRFGLPALLYLTPCSKLSCGEKMPRKHTQFQVVVFLGPPGSGKGTQATRLSAELGIPAISTGEMLRRECRSGSPLGRAVQSILASGQLVHDELMNQVVASRLRERDCRAGCILDGYPRTISQARFLDGLLAGLQKRRPLVFDFEISADEIVARLSRRRHCADCGRTFSVNPDSSGTGLVCEKDGSPLVQRSDDNAETVRERLRLHERNAADLLQYYRGQDYHAICATRAPHEVCDELLNIIAANWSTPMLSRAAAVQSQAELRA